MNIKRPPSKGKLSKIGKKSINLFFDEQISSLIDFCNRDYLYWDQVKNLNIEMKISNQDFWQILKLNRSLNSKHIKFGKYAFSLCNTDKIIRQLHELDMGLGGSIKNISTLSEKEKDFYILSSLKEEAIASSKMEGATTTRKLAKEILRKEEKPTDIHSQMIINNYNTMKYLVEKNLKI